MTSRAFIFALLFALIAISWHPQALPQATKQETSQTTPPSNTPAKKGQTGASHPAPPQEEGERIFQENCSRCHWAPDGFSSRISGTIVRHMRVRASLSQHDAEELLRFLNP